MERDTPLTLKETIDVLTEIYEQHGDLEVQVYTQDGDWYKIWEKIALQLISILMELNLLKLVNR